jgi:F-type H+-transporting ATPase subunit b
MPLFLSLLASTAPEEESGGLIDVVPGLMIWTLIAFGITFFVLRRYAFGPIQKTIDERRERIRAALEEADKAREEARRLLEEHRALIGRAKHDSAEILAEARRVSDAQLQRAKEEVDVERQRRLEETRRQIEAETARAIDQIRAEVADLTIEATERVVGKVLDSADQRRLIEEALEELDFSALERGRR